MPAWSIGARESGKHRVAPPPAAQLHGCKVPETHSKGPDTRYYPIFTRQMREVSAYRRFLAVAQAVGLWTSSMPSFFNDRRTASSACDSWGRTLAYDEGL